MKALILYLLVLVLLTACSASDALHEEFLPLDMAIKRGNGYFENLLIQHPSTQVSADSYMNELKRKSLMYFGMLEPYNLEVSEWKSGLVSGFSVTVWDDNRLILHDCNDTPEIDDWYYNKNVTREDNLELPSCGAPFKTKKNTQTY